MTAVAHLGSRWQRPRRGEEESPDHSRPVVAHFVFPYLFLTGSWIHSQLINTTRHSPIVITEDTENLDTFPFSPLYAYGDLGPTRKMWLGLRAGRRRGLRPAFFARVLRRQRARLIHAHFGYAGAELLDVRDSVGLPMVTSFYGSDATQLARDPVWRERYRRLFSEGQAFLAEGTAMRAALRALDCPPEKIIVHRLGVPLDSLPFKVRRPDASGVVKVLIAGTFREKKGIPYALRAVDCVHRLYPRVQVTLMGDSAGKPGDDEEKREILALIERSSCPVSWIGFQPYSVFQRLLLEHHIFLSPSVTARDGDSEGGAPVSILEAEATGMPVVSSNHADIPEAVIDGESALLSPERDVDSLAKQLERLVAEPVLWESMGRCGRAHIERHHDARVQTSRLEDIYDAVLTGPGTR